MRNPDFQRFERTHGIHFPAAMQFIEPEWKSDFGMAMDAQPTLVTTGNSGIPAFLNTIVDPDVIRILVTPNKAAIIWGDEQKKGDWTTFAMAFPVVERTGETSSYGDFNNNGSTGANLNFPQRQSYHAQTITQWGERELDMYGLAKISYAAELDSASALVLDKFLNQSYFFGVSGLQCYGLLNDPSLAAAVSPITKAAGGTTWAVATANEIFSDIQKLYAALIAQTNGLVDQDTQVVLALPPAVALYLTNTNIYNVNVSDLLKRNFPNIRVETATQYTGTSGINTVQMIATNVQGQKVGFPAYTEKMRAHQVVPDVSSWKQKKSTGTWGSIITFPPGISSMAGV